MILFFNIKLLVFYFYKDIIFIIILQIYY